jgi:hypothetical protein
MILGADLRVGYETMACSHRLELLEAPYNKEAEPHTASGTSKFDALWNAAVRRLVRIQGDEVDDCDRKIRPLLLVRRTNEPWLVLQEA